MTKQFIEPPTLDISICFKNSTAETPLIFVLSTGSDPISDFKRFAEDQEMDKKFDYISLG